MEHSIIDTIEDYRNSIKVINSLLIVMLNASSNDTDDISYENLNDYLKIILQKINTWFDNINKTEYKYIENENFDTIKLEIAEIFQCLKILSNALKYTDNDISFDDISGILNASIKKIKKCIKNSKNVHLAQYPNY